MNIQNDIEPGEPIDLTNCDREPIQFLNLVQPFGALVAVTSDWLVSHLSDNVPDFLAMGILEVGTPLREVISDQAWATLLGAARNLMAPDAVERRFGMSLVPGGPLFDVAMHLSDRTIVLEFERYTADGAEDSLPQVRSLIDRLGSAGDVDKLARMAVRHVQGLTGFARVMVYRFEEDESGEVIAEAKRSDLEPYLDLRYPASDIPRQARALYRRSMLRIISDTHDPGVPIRPDLDPRGKALDLSMGATRAVSPIHLEYLRNMGVRASMSVSIMQGDRLWGLFACHHDQPHVLSYRLRSAIELYAQMFAFLVERCENSADTAQRDLAQSIHDRITVKVAEGASLSGQFEEIIDEMAEVIEFDGAVGWIDGGFHSVGAVPSREQFIALTRFLNTTSAGRIYATDNLSDAWPEADRLGDRIAGLMALPVSRNPRDYIVLFRQEVARTLTWAGNPDKPVNVGPNGARLTPRKSFEAFKQTVHQRSRPWTKGELRVAEALRVTLLEVVLRVTDAAMREQMRASDQQELLIAELNHRVRNILNLIKGLVKQSGRTELDVHEFTQVIGGRINSLARAHDLITRENWNAASLAELMRTEAEAYVSPHAERFQIRGNDVQLQPAAFSVLALVVHEMVTNAAKYGALVDSSGHVEITLTRIEDGALVIDWAERGGPPVQAPKRRGFGTTIVERSIPFELRGNAELHYEVTGLRARFLIPAPYVTQDRTGAGTPAVDPQTPQRGAFELGNVLLVEDNMIIAMDTEDGLLEAGASSVEVSAQVSDAVARIERMDFDCAVLDVHLGQETSEMIADALIAGAVPFVFATGYGDQTSFSKRFPDVPVISKPYDIETLISLIAQAAERKSVAA